VMWQRSKVPPSLLNPLQTQTQTHLDESCLPTRSACSSVCRSITPPCGATAITPHAPVGAPALLIHMPAIVLLQGFIQGIAQVALLIGRDCLGLLLRSGQLVNSGHRAARFLLPLQQDLAAYGGDVGDATLTVTVRAGLKSALKVGRLST
jgi:hypothetical protein